MKKNYESLVRNIELESGRNDREVKIAILGSYTLNNILNPLKYFLYDSGFKPNVRFGGYKQFVQELLDENSWVHEFKPDFVIVALSSKTYLEDLEFSLIDKNPEEVNRYIEEKLEFVSSAVLNLNLGAKIIITNLDHFMVSPYGLMDLGMPGGLHSLVSKFNEGLLKMKNSGKNLEILNFEGLCSIFGKKNMFNEKMYFLGKILLSEMGAEKLAEEISLYVKSSYGKNKKVLVVDLDNTLWGGVVGEDGPLGIRIGNGPTGEAYQETQRVLLNLKKLGTLIAISSKNNESDVLEVFRENKHMILKEEDFVIKKINWLPKSENIALISKQLNLGLDSFVFLDDNPAERLEVKTAFPEVEVIDFPEDVSNLPSLLREMPYFKQVTLTDEDKKRHEMYGQDVKRNELREGSSLEEYLGKLGTTIVVRKQDISSVERISQLINKTNQFNLRTQRYTLEQVKEMMGGEANVVYSLSVRDKFGDLGLTGVIILNLKEGKCFVDTFLMSCRILSRKIELQFFTEAFRDLSKDLIVEAEYIKSPKNIQVETFYESLGFELVEELNGVKKYSKPLKGLQLSNVDWIKVLNE